MILDLDAFAAERRIDTLDALLPALRFACPTYVDVAKLANTEIRSTRPGWVEAAEEAMARYFEDLPNCFQDAWNGVSNALGHGKRIQTLPTSADLAGWYAGTPAIVVGAGPSAAGRLAAVREAHPGAIVFAVDAMAAACVRAGFTPEFVCAVERVPDVWRVLKDADTRGMTLLGPPVLEPQVVDLFGGRALWAWRPMTLDRWLAPGIPAENWGKASGTVALAAALIAGCSPVYLVGCDLCMQGGKIHTPDIHPVGHEEDALVGRDYHHRERDTVNWRGEPVRTLYLYDMLRADKELIVSQYPNQRVIAGGDGMAIRGVERGELPRLRRRLKRSMPRRRVLGDAKDPQAELPRLIAEAVTIGARCNGILAGSVYRPEDMRLSALLGPDSPNLAVWNEILHSFWAAAHVRIELQPATLPDVLRRTARAVAAVADGIKSEMQCVLSGYEKQR